GVPVALISSATRHRRDLQAVPYPPGEPSTMTDTRKDTLRDETHRVFDDADGEDQRRARDEAYVTGLYASPAEADRAYNHLRTSHGYGEGDIDVLMSDETRRTHYGDREVGSEPTGTKAAEGLGAGSAIGGTVGAALGALFAVG